MNNNNEANASSDDPSQDPNSSSNPDPNQNSTLLDGKDPSTPLPMGLTVSSPNPVLSSDIIPAFPYATFFIEDVSEEPYQFPALAHSNPDWYPTVEDPDADNWEIARLLWSGTPGLGENAAQTAVAIWASLDIFRWDLTTVGALSGDSPKTLIDKDVFSTLYLEAPRVGVAAA